MGKRKTTGDYHLLADERGFRWLGDELPANTHTHTPWRCGQGHEWSIPYKNIRDGGGCPICWRRTFKSEEDYHVLAKEREFRWLGKRLPKNVLEKTTWQCSTGHDWQASFSKIQQGNGCRICAIDKQRLTKEDYHALAEKRGLRWISDTLPQNTRTYTDWQCSKGHSWKTSFSEIRRGRGCRACAVDQRRNTEKDYHALASEHGFKWIGKKIPKNVLTTTSWQCDRGHKWRTSYAWIQRGTGCRKCFFDQQRKTEADYHARAKERAFRWIGGQLPEFAHLHTWWECSSGHRWEVAYTQLKGCPSCSGMAPKTEDDYHALAKERGHEWIGDELPQTVHDHTWWRCDQGHKWPACYHGLRACPHCLDMVNGQHVSQLQRDLCAMLSGELNHPVGRYHIDVAIQRDGISIAVEYDAWFWHAHKENHDAKRDQDLTEAGWRVLRIRSNSQLPTLQRVEATIARLMAGEAYAEIVLNDWGIGRTFTEVTGEN